MTRRMINQRKYFGAGTILFILCFITSGKPILANEAEICSNIPQSQKLDCQKAYDLLKQKPTGPQPDISVRVTANEDVWRFEYQLPSTLDDTIASYCLSGATLTLPEAEADELPQI